MFMAAAKALAASSPARINPKNNLLPPVTALRDVFGCRGHRCGVAGA
jgi:malate dehydrogenase (oxaloacetate-decarboxylating)